MSQYTGVYDFCDWVKEQKDITGYTFYIGTIESPPLRFQSKEEAIPYFGHIISLVLGKSVILSKSPKASQFVSQYDNTLTANDIQQMFKELNERRGES